MSDSIARAEELAYRAGALLSENDEVWEEHDFTDSTKEEFEEWAIGYTLHLGGFRNDTFQFEAWRDDGNVFYTTKNDYWNYEDTFSRLVGSKEEPTDLDEAMTEAAIRVSQAPLKDNPVSHPSHYTSHPSGVECIDITKHMGFNLGNALKYIWRCDLKKDAIEDLKKALWYIEKELEMRDE